MLDKTQLLSNEEWALFLKEFGGFPSAALESEARGFLSLYLSLLLEANRAVNLTAIRDWREGVWKHLFDSLFVLKGEPMGTVLDWGTGGGTPGIPLAIWAKYGLSDQAAPSSIVLLDSIGKKMRAVESFLSPLSLSGFVSTVCDRGEHYIAEHQVNSVVMRAVAPPERILAWINPSVSRWIFLIGPKSRADWQMAYKKFENKGLTLALDDQFELPNGLGSRHILRFQRS